MLTITKEKLYGRATQRKHVYRARIGSNDVASEATKEEAVAAAWKQVQDTLDCCMSKVHVGVAKDGAVITVREYQTGCYELRFHRQHDNSAPGVMFADGCEMGRLELDLGPVTAEKMLTHRLMQYNIAIA